MDRIHIRGGGRLEGEVTVAGAKNAALPIMAACLLTDRPCVIDNVPALMDIRTMGRLLGHLGAGWGADPWAGGGLTLTARDLVTDDAPYQLVKTMRASVLVLGPLLARQGRARVSYPGGCAIGPRPIDLHLKALEKMGVSIDLKDGYVHARADRLRGAEITFDKVTVTGTENIVMAATLAEGRTVIRNAAREPEVADLCRALAKMGARIEGAGQDEIAVDGVRTLDGFEHSVMPDRIEAGTYLAAAAITGSRVVLKRAPLGCLDAVTAKFREAGVRVEARGDELEVDARGARLSAVDLTTAPYPGFPTDMQAQFLAVMSLAEGTSVINETIFENRFMHVPELMRLGADVAVDGHRAVVRGVGGLRGAPLMATDLRASASLIVAGLAAQGETVVRRVYHLDRGYERLDQKLAGLGAEIWRERDE